MMTVATCWYNDCALTPEEIADPDMIDGEVVCRNCYEEWRCENESPCPFCGDYYLDEELSGCFVLVDGEFGKAGLYRPLSFPFYSQPLLGRPNIREDAVQRIGSLLSTSLDTEGCPCAYVCTRCMGEVG